MSLKGLGNAIPEATDEDMGTPPMDSTASPAMTDVKDTQLSSVLQQLTPSLQSTRVQIWSQGWERGSSTSRSHCLTCYDWCQRHPAWSHGNSTVDDTTVLVAKPNTKLQKTCQLPGVLALLNWKIRSLSLPYWWISWPVLPLQLAVQ